MIGPAAVGSFVGVGPKAIPEPLQIVGRMPSIRHALKVRKGTADGGTRDAVLIQNSREMAPIFQSIGQGVDDFRYGKQVIDAVGGRQKGRMEECQDFRPNDTTSLPDTRYFRQIDPPAFRLGSLGYQVIPLGIGGKYAGIEAVFY